MGKSAKTGATSGAITVRPVSNKSTGRVEERTPARRLARGRSRFRSAHIEATEKPDEKPSNGNDKRQEKDAPRSTKSDEINPANAKVKETKLDVHNVEKLMKEKQEKEMKEIEQNDEKAVQERQTPLKTSAAKKPQQNYATAKNDADKSKHDKVESKAATANTSKADEINRTDSYGSKPSESDKEKNTDKTTSRSSGRTLTAEERRNGRRYHDIQIVQLESEIEEDGKYRYK